MVIAHDADHARVTSAIAAAKRRVAADIRLVSVPFSSRYGSFALLHSLIAALVGGFVVALAGPPLTSDFLMAIEFVIALAALACLQNRWLRHELVPNASLRKAAWRQARLTYAHVKLKSRHDEPLVLLFCSKLERHVEILVDERVLEKVPAAVWQQIVAEFKPHMRDKREADAFVHLIERSSAALLPFFPTK